MLMVNAESHPVMRRFHKPQDEKRSVVVLDGSEVEQWLEARTEDAMRSLIRPCAPDLMVSRAGRA